MSWQIIQGLLHDRLATVSDLPLIIRENEFTLKQQTDLISSTKTPYTRTTLFPSETIPFTLGVAGEEQYNGTYQAGLFYPEGDQVDAANLMADRIITAFPKGDVLIQGSVVVRIHRAWRATSLQSTNWFQVPVIVRWTSDIS